MFEKDVKGHLDRHGISGVNGNWRTYFVKGRKDHCPTPGGNYKPLYQRTKQRKKQ